MTLPGSFTKVTVTGTYTTLTGELAKGKVTFTPDSKTWLTAVPEKVVIVPRTITADLTNGTFAVDLPATDDPDILPNGGTYVVTEVVGTDSRTYSIQVPVGSGPIDLATVAPVQPVTATSRLVTSVNGVRPNGAGNIVITPASIGALDEAAGDARYAQALQVVPDTVRSGRRIPLGDVATWSAYASGTGTITTGTDPVAGDYLRIATTAQAAYRGGRDLPVRLDGGKVISFLFRRNDANLSVLDLWLGLGAYGTNPGVQWNKGVGTLDVGAWRRVVVHPQERETVAGAPDFADLRALLIRPTPTAATDTSIDIADIRVHDGVKPGWVSFVFDDGRRDTYAEAFPRMQAKGYPAGIAVEHTAVGNPDRCTLAQLQEMYAAGWDMYGHHVVQMTTLDEANQVVVHRASKAFLSANGLRRGERIWVWPGGARTPATEAIARRYWQTMRRVAAFNVLGSPHIYEPVDPALFYVTSTATLATLKDRIDRIAASGGHLVFVLHSLVTTPVAAEDWAIADFQALLDYIDTTDVLVKPASEAWTL